VSRSDVHGSYCVEILGYWANSICEGIVEGDGEMKDGSVEWDSPGTGS
jgi:hypothetical protein